MTLTAEQHKLCHGLVIHPPGIKTYTISKEEFLRRFPTAVEHGKLALWLLEEAYRAQSESDLVCALIVGGTFGFGPEHVDILCRLIEVDWHFSHEAAVSALDDLRTPAAVDALFLATQRVPKYLEFDENRALASNAIWALGNIATKEADEKLKIIAESSDNPDLREKAMEQLKRRHEQP